MREIHFHIELIDKKFHGGKWLIACGSFAYTSDSRFPASHPFSIRNRDENLAGAAFEVTDTDVHAIAHYKIESIDFSHPRSMRV